MKIKNREGSTLVMTLMVFVILMIFGTFILSFMVNENKQSMYHQNKTQAYYIARSGAVAVEAAILDLGEAEIQELNKALVNVGEIPVNEIYIDDNKANVIIKKKEKKGEEEKYKIVIESTAKVGNSNEKVVKVLERTTVTVSGKFSIDHAIFSHGDINFSNGSVTGNIATNGNIKVDGNTNINGDIYLNGNSSITHNGNNSPEYWWFKDNNIYGKIKTLEGKIIYPPQKFPDYFNGNPINMPKLSKFPNYDNNPGNLKLSPDISYTHDVNEKTIDTSSRYEKITMAWNKILIIDARYKNIDIWVQELTGVYEIVIKGDNKVNLHVKSKMETNNSNGKPFNFEGNSELNIYYSGSGGNFGTNNGGNQIKANLYLNPSSPGINISNVSVYGNIYVYNGDFATGGGLKNPRILGNIYSQLGDVLIPDGDVEGDIYIHQGNFIKSNGGGVKGDIYLNKGDVKMPNGNLEGDIHIYQGNFIKSSGGSVKGDIYLNKGDVEMPNGNLEGNIYLKQGNLIKTNSGNITGNIYQDVGELNLTGSGSINGSLITNGNKVTVSGGSKIADGIVYAPNADVKLKGSGTIHGALIANYLSNEGGTSIIFDKDIIKNNIDLIDLGIFGSNESTTTIIKPGYFE